MTHVNLDELNANINQCKYYTDDQKISIKLLDIHTRYLSMDDFYKKDRDRYVFSLFGKTPTRNFADNETYFLSKANGNFDCLVIGGSDVKRIGRFLAANRPLIRSVIKIAVIMGPSPARVAYLLNAGFDEVLMQNETLIHEAAARINNIWRRFQEIRTKQIAYKNGMKRLELICDLNDMTKRELAIINYLYNSVDKTASLSDICLQINPGKTSNLGKSVRSTISQIRRKLKAGYEIRAVRPNAYGIFEIETKQISR